MKNITLLLLGLSLVPILTACHDVIFDPIQIELPTGSFEVDVNLEKVDADVLIAVVDQPFEIKKELVYSTVAICIEGAADCTKDEAIMTDFLLAETEGKAVIRVKQKQVEQLHEAIGTFELDDTVFYITVVVQANESNELESKISISKFAVKVEDIQDGSTDHELLLPVEGITFKNSFNPTEIIWIGRAFLRTENEELTLIEPGNYHVRRHYWLEEVDEKENWVEIYTEDGWVRANLEVPPQTEMLESLLAPFGNGVSVFFKNIESGFIFRHNAERIYIGASIPKAFFAMYLYQRADRGEIDLDTHIAGISQRRLLAYSLYRSYNDTPQILARHHGLAGYNQWLIDHGLENLRATTHVFGRNALLSANDAGMMAYAMYQYIHGEQAHSEELHRYLLMNWVPFITSSYYPVASKSGFIPNWNIFHDLAIVHAPSPYILVILTQHPIVARNYLYHIGRIADAFEDFNREWFQPLESNK